MARWVKVCIKSLKGIVSILLLTLLMACSKQNDVVPEIKITTELGRIYLETVNISGEVLSYDFKDFEGFGICWDLDTLPTVLSSIKEIPLSESKYVSEIMGLKSGTKYHFRPFLLTKDDVFYGDPISLKTLDSFSEALQGGYSIDELLLEGYSFLDLLNGEVEVSTFIQSGHTLSDFNKNGIAVEILIEYASIDELFTLNVDPYILLSLDFGLFALREAGYVFDLNELEGQGFGVGFLLKNGYSEQELSEVDLMGSLTDIDGNTYRWVKIGDQKWMADHLQTKTYNDGTPILQAPKTVYLVSSPFISDPAFTYWKDNEANWIIYNSFVAQASSICPQGWHVPNSEEVNVLMNFVDFDAKALASQDGWIEPSYQPQSTMVGVDQENNNNSGFNAKPYGILWGEGWFQKEYLYLWTREANPMSLRNISSQPRMGGIFLSNSNEIKYQYSCIRCIKD